MDPSEENWWKHWKKITPPFPPKRKQILLGMFIKYKNFYLLPEFSESLCKSKVDSEVEQFDLEDKEETKEWLIKLMLRWAILFETTSTGIFK